MSPVIRLMMCLERGASARRAGDSVDLSADPPPPGDHEAEIDDDQKDGSGNALRGRKHEARHLRQADLAGQGP
jgi:hypothetical protein